MFAISSYGVAVLDDKDLGRPDPQAVLGAGV
jgi:hypothetical protein